MSNKCPICKKVTKFCICDEKICICGHNLGEHRFFKTQKANCCGYNFFDNETNYFEDCPCHKFKQIPTKLKDFPKEYKMLIKELEKDGTLERCGTKDNPEWKVHVTK